MKPATKTPAPADDAPASLPVVLTLTAPAQRRTDLPDVYTAEVEQRGRVLLRRHYRRAEGGVEDVTELVTEILLAKAKGVKDAEQVVQAEQVARVGSTTPNQHRAARGRVVEQTAVAGKTRARALSALGVIRQRDLLTTRQWEAGDRMAQDAKVVAGAREPKDEAVVVDDSAGRSWEDFAIDAGSRLNLARETCQAMPSYEGTSPWTMVEGVVLLDRAITDIVASTNQNILRRAKIALRIGLDAVGDVYRLPSAVTRTHVLGADGIPVPMTVTEDLDGLDRQEQQRRMWRSIKLGDRLYVAVGDTMSDLYAVAKTELKRRANPK
ncbi:hypothetical protein AZL_020270 [Azospirillum sp. B510]|uniref:hypothetical protein n=1 Tax=Azospirillum sp. (strain B510) TaxID=137722 RepID=UPI0001C4C367|nr:hypothetical protein [Azospirillum sp. B510]BAI71488.1 hypothetical protein AZL_008500 [Azospirillum sp. B510]BAI72665.1 hypothetical protein AZL_020270 [Azospirillum sp. B510]